MANCTLYPHLVESCNPIDEEALLEFRRGIEYESSGRLSTWIPMTDCCASWYGVECDVSKGRVIEVSPFRDSDIMDIGKSIFVNGTISPFLGNLTYLRVLSLYHFQENYHTNPNGFTG